MSLMNMILFGSIVLTIYGSVNFYILRRGWQSLSGHGPLRVFFLVVILFLILSYPLGRFLERPLRGLLTDFLVIVGSFYLALMIYFFLLILAVDFFRLLNAFLNFFPKAVTDNGPRAAFLAFWIVLALSLATVFLGYINASRLRFRDIEVTIAKPGGRYAGLRIVSASDIHFGTVLDGGRLRKIVDMINSAKPDLVLLPGDTLDEDVSENKAAELSRILKDVRAPLGVYAVLGNHEYYAGVEKSLAALRASGVTVLQDEAVKAGNSLILAGRKDRTALREREPARTAIYLLFFSTISHITWRRRKKTASTSSCQATPTTASFFRLTCSIKGSMRSTGGLCERERPPWMFPAAPEHGDLRSERRDDRKSFGSM
jgi:hypothetical protein